MKIAVISNVAGYSWAGSEELWHGAAMRALSDGNEVIACLHKDLYQSPSLSSFKKAGGRLLEWASCGIARLENIRQRFVPSFSDQALSHPDIILVSAGSIPALGFVPGLLDYLQTTKIPYVILCQFNADCLAISASERSMGRKLLLESACNIFVSKHNLELAARQYALHFPAAHVIYNPIRTQLSEPLPYPRIDAKIIFGCMARFETLWKGQDLLLEVMANVKWQSRIWNMVFYGTGPDEEHIQNSILFRGLADRVKIAGYIRNLEVVWQNTHIKLLPSRGEGTPLAIMEAMMCGRPVITTHVGGNTEIIEDGVTGFIAEAPTPQSFAATLERAWTERHRWEEMGKAAHARAKELAKADPPGQLLQILEEIVKA